MEEVRKLAIQNKPKLIWCGATAYPRKLPFKEFAAVADEVGAYFAADVSHVAGLIIGGVHETPVPYADIVTTTTHKTLRGPRGGIIMVTQKGLEKDPELANKIDKAIIPGLQGGPHNHQTAAIAVALGEAQKPEFKQYAEQIVKNSKELARCLTQKEIKLVSNGTDNHLLLVDLTPFGKGKGIFVEEALDEAHITVNKNTIPGEPSSAFYPSGIRLGTPAITTRGLKESKMEQISEFLACIVKEIAPKYEFPEDKESRTNYLAKFRSELKQNQVVQNVKTQVIQLCKEFPLYTNLDY